MQRSISRLLAIGLLVFGGSAVAQEPGDQPNSAIPISLGSTVEDIGDRVQRPFIHYKIALARGQKFTVTIRSASSTRNLSTTYVGIFGPGLRARPTCCRFSQANLLAQERYGDPGSLTYEVASSGEHYVVLYFDGSGIRYSLRVVAEGTPIAVPNPATAGCLSGRVDSITYSLQLIAAGLPDEVTIGGTRACTSCQVKPPAYPEISSRLENALRSRISVEACYDSEGKIFQLKMAQ